ncbi:MAG: methylmalonyl-CoA mutase family protein, partial [Terriglobales bacterium]
AVQEVAFTLADAIAYVDAAVAAGLALDEFAPRLSFFFNAHSNLLEEVAKFRAARRMWARRMRECFHAKNPKSWMLRFHTQTAGSTLTAQQPQVNVVRTAYEALAGVLGGTQSLHTNAFDEALGLPTEDAARLALRTQQVLAYETGVPEVVDPLAGSYYVESLTNQLEQAAETYLEKIEAWGGPLEGMLQAIESGYVQREIQNAAYEQQQRLENGEAVVVGVNRFQQQEAAPTPVLRIAAEVERKQCERLRVLRQQRDARHTEAALSRVAEAAAGSENLMPSLIAAVEAGCTVGEIANSLRTVFGEYRETVVV